MKRVLVLNIRHNELRMIQGLKELGYYVIGTGGVPGLIGEKYVDEYIQADYSNKELILQMAIDHKIDRICACCNDFGVLTAAYVAEKLGLPGHDTYANAMTIHHKDKFKAFAKAYNLQTPIAQYFDDIDIAKDQIKEEYPLIVKPIDLTGGKGVSRANNHEEAMAAVELAFSVSRAKHIVIEPYIEGTQHAICTYLVNQKVVAYGSNDEYSFQNPYKVEIDTYPATGIEKVKDILINEIEKIANILKLNDGIFHVQYICKDGKPYIIECMRRVLGNLYGLPCGRLNNLNWDLWQAKAYCGEDLSNFPQNVKSEGYWAYRTVMCKENGVPEAIHIDDDVKKYVFDEFWTWKSGDVITNHMVESLGFYFMKFETAEEMHSIAVDGYNKIYAIMKR